jgi:hypothetical protein
MDCDLPIFSAFFPVDLLASGEAFGEARRHRRMPRAPYWMVFMSTASTMTAPVKTVCQ